MKLRDLLIGTALMTLAAVNTNVIMMPMMRPRTVSSLRMFAAIDLDRWKRRIV
jgi:hypothetical protein